jgi:hypothetical protein
MRLATAVAAVLFAAAAQAQDTSAALKFSGYAKTMLAGSTTVVGAEEHYTLDSTRLRLELKGTLTEQLNLDLQYDNELLLGDYLGTAQFKAFKDQDPGTYWHAQSAYLDRADAYARHRLYRAALTASVADTDVHIGRQRIAWGTGRFWSPLDILNPLSATALEREERAGVDALLVEHKLDALSRAALVYAPQHDAQDHSLAAMWHGNRAGVDCSLVAGRFRRDNVLGLDLAGQMIDAGVRAEITRTFRRVGIAYTRALLGLDYAFVNTLTLSGELFYDGAGAIDRSRYDLAALLAGRVQNLARRYLGVSARYEITPLLKTRHDLVVNLDDHSRYYSPTLSYSIRDDLDAILGAQLFAGAEGSEFAAFKRLLYVQLQWYF